MSEYLLTSEAVADGHPDKVCDQIADTLLDVYLSRDDKARTAIEVLATTNQVVLAGEVSSSELLSLEEMERIVRTVVKEIGYEQAKFHYKNINIDNFIHSQSADIAEAVVGSGDYDKDLGAGDQGIMFGYATNEAPDTEYMPASYFYANAILRELKAARANGEYPFLRPDAKAQVTLLFEDNKPVKAHKIVVSTQHDKEVDLPEVQKAVGEIIAKVMPKGWLPSEEDILINPSGRFVIGGPNGDTGLTGRKIIVDTYGGNIPHGGGAFSGKDATKVDRSAAYMARYVAKNIVAAGLADRCLIQLAYAIGVSEPMAVYANTFSTGKISDVQLTRIINDLFDFSPSAIIGKLGLLKPIYRETSTYGHFGRKSDEQGHFSWEKIDCVQDLQNAL